MGDLDDLAHAASGSSSPSARSAAPSQAPTVNYTRKPIPKKSNMPLIIGIISGTVILIGVGIWFAADEEQAPPPAPTQTQQQNAPTNTASKMFQF